MVPRWLMALLVLLQQAWSARREPRSGSSSFSLRFFGLGCRAIGLFPIQSSGSG